MISPILRTGVLLVLVPLALPAGSVMAQVLPPSGAPPGSARVLGVVSDHERGEPLEQASVSLSGGGADVPPQRTDEEGQFLFPGVPPGTYQVSVSALGYTTLFDTVQVMGNADTELGIELSVSPIALEPIVTVVPRNPFLEGFHERRATGIGTYIDRAEIEGRNANRLTDLMRTVPGARVVPLPNGGNGMRFRGGCVPSFWVNGIRTPSDARTEIPLDEGVRPEEIEAIEVYRVPATVPAQFRPESCGSVVIWTRLASLRVDGMEETKGSFWSRLVILGGFVLLGVVVGS